MSMLRLTRRDGAALVLAVYDGQLRVAGEGSAITFLARAPVDKSLIITCQPGTQERVLRVGETSVLISAAEADLIRAALPCVAIDTGVPVRTAA